MLAGLEKVQPSVWADVARADALPTALPPAGAVAHDLTFSIVSACWLGVRPPTSVPGAAELRLDAAGGYEIKKR